MEIELLLPWKPSLILFSIIPPFYSGLHLITHPVPNPTHDPRQRQDTRLQASPIDLSVKFVPCDVCEKSMTMKIDDDEPTNEWNPSFIYFVSHLWQLASSLAKQWRTWSKLISRQFVHLAHQQRYNDRDICRCLRDDDDKSPVNERVLEKNWRHLRREQERWENQSIVRVLDTYI